MNFTTTALSALTILGSVVAPVSAQSTYGLDSGHQGIVNHVKANGFSFVVNPEECWGTDLSQFDADLTETPAGWYDSYNRKIVICQQNKSRPGVVQHDWDEFDLDTVRHEAHHMVQDCMTGVQDGELGKVYKSPRTLAGNVLSTETYHSILNDWYRTQTDHIKTMELEAFAVAEMNDTAEQVRDIKKYCF